MKKDMFIWSDGWCLEDNKAWFVDGKCDTLFYFDFNTGICKYLTAFPNNNESKFRLNSNCIKVGNNIFCMPDRGECIWIYDVASTKFSQIKIDNPDNVRLSCIGIWQYGDKIFTFSGGLKQIIEIDIREKVIVSSYTITNLPDENLCRCIKVGMNMYLLSSISNKIYEFDLESKKVITHILPGVEQRLFTICFDGSKFWMSGYNKEICVWDKEKNHIEILYDFPKDFGEYDFSGKEEFILNFERNKYNSPAFIDSRVIGENIWFIPFRTNKIIYIDRNTYKIQVFEMPDEEETKKSLISNDMAAKYLTQYVLDNRYLGLYSFKNKRIIEIDTKCFQKRVKTAIFDFEEYKKELCEPVFGEGVLYDRRAFEYFLMTRKKSTQISGSMQIGEKIYRMM